MTRRVAGRWTESTLTGSKTVTVDGVTFALPDDAVCRLVTAGRVSFVHVKVGREVYVLSPQLGMLDETPDERKARAAPAAWGAVLGERIVAH